jgi:O-antigen/teichoic acid export membrane protein
VTLVVNVALNAVLIPRFSYFGASCATVISLATSSVMHLAALWPTDLRPSLRHSLLRPAAALVVTWLAAYGCERWLWPAGARWTVLPVDAGWGPFLVAFGASVLLYLVVLVALRAVSRDDLALLLDLVRGDRGSAVA